VTATEFASDQRPAYSEGAEHNSLLRGSQFLGVTTIVLFILDPLDLAAGRAGLAADDRWPARAGHPSAP